MGPVLLLILSVILTGVDGSDGDAKEENAGGDSGEDADGDDW